MQPDGKGQLLHLGGANNNITYVMGELFLHTCLTSSRKSLSGTGTTGTPAVMTQHTDKPLLRYQLKVPREAVSMEISTCVFS